jgi:hypothetical protein
MMGDVSFGGPCQVPDEVIQRLFDVAVSEVVQLLQSLKN